MGLVNIFFGRTPGVQFGNSEQGVLTFDATLSETHGRTSVVTENPVEEGANIVDHIRIQPKTLQINGIISARPIVILAPIAAQSPVGTIKKRNQNGSFTVDDKRSTTRIEEGLAFLENIWMNGGLVDIFTSLTPYNNMAITEMQYFRDSERGNILDASIFLKEVIQVRTRDIPALKEPLTASNKSKTDEGNKPTQDAGENKAKRTQASGKEFNANLGRSAENAKFVGITSE